MVDYPPFSSEDFQAPARSRADHYREGIFDAIGRSQERTADARLNQRRKPRRTLDEKMAEFEGPDVLDDTPRPNGEKTEYQKFREQERTKGAGSSFKKDRPVDPAVATRRQVRQIQSTVRNAHRLAKVMRGRRR